MRQMTDKVMRHDQQVGLLERFGDPLKHGGKDAMPSGYGEFIFLDPLPFLCPLPFNLLRRGCIRMMHTAGKIGTHSDDLSPLTAIHDDSFSHLVARSLKPNLLCAHTVGLRLLDLQF